MKTNKVAPVYYPGGGFPYVGKAPPDQKSNDLQDKQEMTPEEKQKEANFAKHDKHLHNQFEERIQDHNDLPKIEDWSQYKFYKRKNYYIMNPRLPSMRTKPVKFCCRRIYRIVTLNGTISDAYISTIKNEMAILFAIAAGIASTVYKKFNPDTPPTESEHHLNTIAITTNILIIMIVFAGVGLAKDFYNVTCIFRTDKQDAQRALFDDYENQLKDEMVIFSTRSWRFDSAGEAGALEVAQAVWSEDYNRISRATGLPQSIAQFFLWESDSLRGQLFKDVPSKKDE